MHRIIAKKKKHNFGKNINLECHKYSLLGVLQ